MTLEVTDNQTRMVDYPSDSRASCSNYPILWFSNV